MSEDLDLMERLLECSADLDWNSPLWARAYQACAQGRFSDAMALAQFPQQSAGSHADRLRITAGSALRQMMRYMDADRVERAPSQDPHLQAHLLVSRAANHVGLGKISASRDLLNEIGDLQPSLEADRVLIRKAWVQCEVELSSTRPKAALDRLLEMRADTSSRLERWPRHRAKTMLFEGVVRAQLNENEAARRLLLDAAKIAEEIHAQPVLSVAGAVLASLSS